jgi:hypothetical protein
MTDKEYYNDREYITNSMLGWVVVGPWYYKKKYDEKDDEEIPSYYKFGTAVHCNLLEDDRFKKDYYISQHQSPQNAVQSKFCDLLIDSHHDPIKSLEYAYRLSYSCKDKPDKRVLEDANSLYKTYEKYILQERKNGQKIMLTNQEYDRVMNIRNNIKRHPIASNLTWTTFSHNQWFVTNELILFGTINGVKMKGKIDRLIIDYKEKSVIIIDYKTFSTKYDYVNSKKKFLESIDKLDYDRQAAVYIKLVRQFILDNYPEIKGLDTFKFEYKIIAIKSNFDNEVRVYTLGPTYIERGNIKMVDAIGKLKFYEKHGYDFDIDHMHSNGDELIEL